MKQKHFPLMVRTTWVFKGESFILTQMYVYPVWRGCWCLVVFVSLCYQPIIQVMMQFCLHVVGILKCLISQWEVWTQFFHVCPDSEKKFEYLLIWTRFFVKSCFLLFQSTYPWREILMKIRWSMISFTKELNDGFSLSRPSNNLTPASVTLDDL